MNSQPPIAYDLSAMKDNELKEHRENSKAVLEAISKIRETAKGQAFRLPADQKPVWLELSGRDGVKQYIKETLLPKLNANVKIRN